MLGVTRAAFSGLANQSVRSSAVLSSSANAHTRAGLLAASLRGGIAPVSSRDSALPSSSFTLPLGLTGVIRRAHPSDVMQIASLLEEPVKRGAILPISIESIQHNLHNWFVYEDSDHVLAISYLKSHSVTTSEMSKIFTRPECSGKGIAGCMVSAMANAAASEGKSYAFALTLDAAMSKVFTRHGFSKLDRSKLCSEWRANYDLTRPSTAYGISLSAPIEDMMLREPVAVPMLERTVSLFASL